MTRMELFYFIGQCLSLDRNDENREKITHEIKNNEVNWEHFVELTSGHLVLPSVYLNFKQQKILPLLPKDLVNHLQLVYELNLQRNVGILSQIDEINRLLAVAGISPIYLKGAGNMLDHLYKDLGERIIGDIDLLVAEGEFLPAAKILKKEGYEHACPFYEEEQGTLKHFPRLVHPQKNADVEIHRVPVELNLSAHFNYDVIYPEKKQIETNPLCFVLSDRHKAILNFMHGFMNRDVKLLLSISYRNMVDLLYLTERVNVVDVFSSLPDYPKQARIYIDFMGHAMKLKNQNELEPQSIRFIRKSRRLKNQND